MVYGLNQPQQNQNLTYGAIKDVVPQDVAQRLPQNVQNFDVQDTFENNSTVQMVTSKSSDVKTGALTLGIWGSFIGLRSLLDKATAGDWDKSLFGRITRFGDAVSSGLNKVTFGLSGKAARGISKGTGRAAKFLSDHFDFAAALKTPLKYESTEAIKYGNGMAGRYFTDDILNAVRRFDETKLVDLFKNVDDFKGLDAAGIIKKFEQISVNPLGKENAKVVNDIMQTFAKSGETFTIKHFNAHLPFIGDFKIPLTGKFNPLRIFQVKMSGTSIANKFKTLAKTSTGKTALGKNLAYVSGSATEGLTSCIVGGKVAPVIQAFIIANAIKKTIEAPKGEKLSTFMDEMVPQAAFFMTMPYTTKAFASIGGNLKYRGMSGEVDKAFINQIKNNTKLLEELGLTGKDLTKLARGDRQKVNVEQFRSAVRSLNEKIKAGTIDGVQYQAELKNVKKLLKGNSKWYQKPFKWIGNILGGGYKNETVLPFIRENGSKFTNFMSKVGYQLKTKGGGALRFAAVMFVISPLIAKPITWITHKIFGKPYDPEAKKAEEAKKAMEESFKNLNMTEEQMIAKLQAHPEIVAAIQSDPKMLEAIQKDPSILIQLIASLPDAPANGQQNAPINANGSQSSLLKNYINNPQNHINPQGAGMQTQQNAFSQNQGLNQTQALPASGGNTMGAEPKRSYIPSSKPFNAMAAGAQASDGTVQGAGGNLSNIPVSGVNNVPDTSLNATGDNFFAANNTAIGAPNSAVNNNAVNPDGQITNQNVQNMLLKADKAMDEAMKLL